MDQEEIEDKKEELQEIIEAMEQFTGPILGMVASIYTKLSESEEVLDAIATFYRNFRDALQRKGFDRETANMIVSRFSAPGTPSK